MVKKSFTLPIILGFGAILTKFVMTFTDRITLPMVSQHYLTEGPTELGAANIVTSVVVTYRGLDTLGEVTILFAAAAIVSMLIKHNGNQNQKRTEGSELLQSGAKLLFPLIILFGVYVFINGHLTPGGGFQGGAIIASGVMLLVLAYPNAKFSTKAQTIIESISGFTYVGLGILGLLLGGGFLDNRILPLGEFGTLFSAGLIPIIYTLIGLKVGAELSSVVLSLKGDTTDEGVV